ncbi:MAG: Imm42 family immunity protein [Candidatus Sphingomonas phytovorans]|nr:Imm42 family immunity protein [Sphingomonas sp.]WEJ98611.1 MAG: Imm42 family immunity protein [Sphingomonas sp.]
MIVGDQSSFAIESSITEAFPSLSQRALGYFVVHVRGKIFGVREPDASMLGCSFSEVKDRLGRRGTHGISYLSDVSAPVIVEAFLDAIYRDVARSDYFSYPKSEFSSELYGSKIPWAPDGDEAFDDGSHILQFDVGEKVRLIAFQNMDCSVDTAKSIEEEWIDGDIFYGVLAQWSALFLADWSGQVCDANPEAGII